MSFAHAVVARALPEPGRPSSPSPWEVGETARPYRTERSLGQAHQVAVSLAAARARVILPLAKVAATVVAGRAHREFGYSSLEDFCRERHGRGARCVRDLAVLQGHFEKLPALAAAVSGDDGGPPLHVSAAMAIGSVATPENVDRWIARGREVTLDHLKKEIRAQAGADAVEPDRVQVRMSVHPVVLAVFDEVLDLHRAVVGSEGSVTSFVESMVAEAMTEPEPSALAGLEGRTDALVRGADPAVAEEAREKAAGGWADLPRSGKGSWALRLAGSSLKQLEGLMKVAGTGDARRLDRQLGQLLRLQNALELRLGETLREMGEMRGWDRLGFEDAGHYAERILSMSRTSAEDRVWVAGAIRPFALVRQAYERGELTWEATRSVLRLMQGCVGSDLEGQKKWIEHGRACTVKRLRDEAKARRRSLALEPAKPMSDEAWYASLRLEPRTATKRMAEFGAHLVSDAERQTAKSRMDEMVMRLRLPVDVAADFMRAVRVRYDAVRAKVNEVPEFEPWPDPAAPASVLVTRTFSTRGWRPPLWVGLLGLLEDCVRQWDPKEANVGGPDKRELFARSGYRCSVPACTRRATLEDHHLVFLSAGGGQELSNRETLCWFHHHVGIHGGLAKARGKAPLGIRWTLGRDGVGGRFRNEMRL